MRNRNTSTELHVRNDQADCCCLKVNKLSVSFSPPQPYHERTTINHAGSWMHCPVISCARLFRPPERVLLRRKMIWLFSLSIAIEGTAQ